MNAQMTPSFAVESVLQRIDGLLKKTGDKEKVISILSEEYGISDLGGWIGVQVSKSLTIYHPGL